MEKTSIYQNWDMRWFAIMQQLLAPAYSQKVSNININKYKYK
jgi:hypothetical protein